MEITYDTGAKVILQGPVTYSVEANGGYLAVGKLTGKLEKKADVSTLAIHPFSVHTPTVTVTDLGTEFGVEVDNRGCTTSHVFRGAVEVKLESASIGKEKEDHTVVLRENESVRVEQPSAAGGPRFTSLRAAAKPDGFVRSLPPPKKPLPIRVLAYFRMGEDDPEAAAGKPANEEIINHGHRYHLKKYGSPTYTADAAPGSTLAMNFHGAEKEYFSSRYLCWTPLDDFILEAWVRPNRVTDEPACIVYSGRPENGCALIDGYGLFVIDRHYKYMIGNVAWSPPLVPVEAGKWTHLALVCEQGKVQFWLNGRLVHEAGKLTPIASSGHFMIGGVPDSITIPHAFNGQIDEVRLSEFQGPFDPKMLLFQDVAGTLRVPSAGSATHVGNVNGTRSVPATFQEGGKSKP